MTSIEQIQISGVRSFDPNPVNRQTIVFQKPLTVILGKNGAGKTTIIEALLNACTGQMPPGSGSEKSSFIYDPKVMGETDVKAQIRLLFTGKGGKVMQVIRSFQATRTRTKTTFSTLDNTVAYQDAATGKVVSSTYRANDVDRAVPEMLGVSPAVLEHVIFCHQEDGNWPLSPPKDVKKIFDDIFAATRYVLALDRLRENSKEFRRQQKELEANLMALREHRDQALQLSGDIDAKEEAVRTIQSKAKALEPQLKQLHDVAAALSAVEQNAESLAREAAIIQGRIEEKKQSVDRANLPPVKQTLEEMLELRRDFGEHVKKLETEVMQKDNLLDVAEATKRTHEETALGLRSKIRFLEQQEQQYKRNCADLQRVVKDASGELVMGEDDMDEPGLQRISDGMSVELRKATEERDKVLRGIDDEVKNIEEKRAIALRSMDADSKEKEMKEEQLKHLQEQIGGAEEALRKLKPHVSHAQLNGLRETITNMEQRVEAVETLKKSSENYRQRHDILQKVDAQNRVVAELRQELARHKQRTGGEAEMNLLRSQIAEKQDSLNAGLQEMLIPALSNFGYEADEAQSLTHTSILVERLRDQKAEALRVIRAERSELDRQVAVLQQKRSQHLEDMMRESEELKRKRATCAAALGDGELERFEAVLDDARDTLHKANHRCHALEAMATCYANFVEVAKGEGRCPVCDRSFSDEAALDSFVQLNEVQQRASPENVQKAQAAAVSAERRLRRLERVETDVHEVRRLTANAPVLENLVKTINEELANKRALLEDVDRKCDGIEEQMKRVQELVRAAADLNAVASEMHALRQQLARREATVVEMRADAVAAAAAAAAGANDNDGFAGVRTYEQLSSEYEQANAELYRLNVLLNEAQRREDGDSDQTLANELSAKRAEFYQAEMKLMRQSELEGGIARCRGEANGYRERTAAIDACRAELQTQVDGLNSRLETLRQERQTAELTAQAGRLGQVEESLRVMTSLMPKVREYITSRYGEQLATAREKLRGAETLSLTVTEEVKQLRTDIQEARRVVDEQYRSAAEMEKHIDVLEKRQSIVEDEARLQEVRRALSELKGKEVHGVAAVLGSDVIERESVSRIRELIRDKTGELERARAQQEGNVEAMVQDIAGLKRQLARDKYQDVEKRYRSTFLKVQTTEIAVADIEKYYRALEKAVQSYHQEKIAQINQILADLWRQTYKGSDIDTVELRSEDDVTSTTARRSYSYRVVMKRGNSEMDMRGRCSAGQKVLASVLIRLALSEAFCCDCGILALDEPTTNLDEDNARSLAESLRLLIDRYRSLKHFQLIVITHDEQFVRALGGQALDTFYYIHKDREGAFSVIEERTFDQLFAA